MSLFLWANVLSLLAVFEELKSILQKQSQIESYTDWIDSLIDKCVLKVNYANCEFSISHVFTCLNTNPNEINKC